MNASAENASFRDNETRNDGNRMVVLDKVSLDAEISMRQMRRHVQDDTSISDASERLKEHKTAQSKRREEVDAANFANSSSASRSTPTYQYSRTSHFLSVLRQQQAKQRVEIPQKLLVDLRAIMAEQRIDARSLTSADVRKLLLRTGNRKYSQNAAQIVTLLGGQQPPDLSEKVAFSSERVEENDDKEEQGNSQNSAESQEKATKPVLSVDHLLPPEHVFDDCSICTDAIEHATHRRLDECGHIFHRACIAQWFEKSETCPLCRTRIVVEKALGVDFNAFARDFRGKSLESMLVRLFDMISQAYNQVREAGANMVSYEFLLRKMSTILVETTALCDSNKETLRRVAAHCRRIHNPFRVLEEERAWNRILRQLERAATIE